MKRNIKFYLMIFFIIIIGKVDLLASSYGVDISDGSVFIEKSITKDIDIIQNNSIIHSVYNNDNIVIEGNSTLTSNYVDIDANNLVSSMNIQLNKIKIDTSNKYHAGIYVHGTSSNNIDVNLSFNGNSKVVSNGKYSGNTSNGISGKFADNVNLIMDSNSKNEFSGFDSGIYWKNGNLTINSGDYNIYSTYSDNAIAGTGIYVNTGSFTMNGGSITANARSNGIYITKKMIINGGNLSSTGEYRRGLYVSGYLEINGGIINATGVTYGLQAGESSSNSLCFRVNGGTITANSIGSTDDYKLYGKNPKINGGSIKGNISSIQKLVNSDNEEVTLYQIRLEEQVENYIEECEINGVDCVLNNPSGTNYGINDTKTDNSGVLYFYLTKLNTATIIVNSIRYQNDFTRTDEMKYKLFKDRVLSFHFKDGENTNQVKFHVPYGNIYSGEIPSTPKVNGYTFLKWINKSDNSYFDFNSIIREDTSLNATYLPNVLALDAIDLEIGIVNKEYSFTLNKASGGVPKLNYSLSGLPQGLKYSPISNTISGIPQKSGTYNLKFTVSDSHSPSQKKTVALELIIKDDSNTPLPITGITTPVFILIALSALAITLYRRKLTR